MTGRVASIGRLVYDHRTSVYTIAGNLTPTLARRRALSTPWPFRAVPARMSRAGHGNVRRQKARADRPHDLRGDAGRLPVCPFHPGRRHRRHDLADGVVGFGERLEPAVARK